MANYSMAAHIVLVDMYMYMYIHVYQVYHQLPLVHTPELPDGGVIAKTPNPVVPTSLLHE